MPVLFVHGVPSTSRLWGRILSLLDRTDEVEAPDLPGFAAEPPAGWTPVKESYVDWVIGRLEGLHARGGPVHLVGHDWGCLLALRAASLRPELLRSLAVGNAPIDPHWPIHNLWREWMIPGLGERISDQLAASPNMRDILVSLGFPEEDADRNAFTYPGSARRIMELYRSAINIGHEWAEDLARIVVPSMFIWGEKDLIVSPEIGRRMATRVGAEFVTLDADHFWPYEAPEAAASALQRLWRRSEKLPYTILTQPAFSAG
jgi:pimeloyl-ACP methyl ester carboxylesterase